MNGSHLSGLNTTDKTVLVLRTDVCQAAFDTERQKTMESMPNYNHSHCNHNDVVHCNHALRDPLAQSGQPRLAHLTVFKGDTQAFVGYNPWKIYVPIFLGCFQAHRHRAIDLEFPDGFMNSRALRWLVLLIPGVSRCAGCFTKFSLGLNHVPYLSEISTRNIFHCA